jgi:hypothetical protein
LTKKTQKHQKRAPGNHNVNEKSVLLDSPELYFAVITSAGNYFAVGRDINRLHFEHVTTIKVDLFSRLYIPKSYWFIVCSTDYFGAVRSETDAASGIFVTFKYLRNLSGCGIKNLDQGIASAKGNEPVVGTECQRMGEPVVFVFFVEIF